LISWNGEIYIFKIVFPCAENFNFFFFHS
jgi:hypothetical protein